MQFSNNIREILFYTLVLLFILLLTGLNSGSTSKTLKASKNTNVAGSAQLVGDSTFSDDIKVKTIVYMVD
jgi:hypothetical protein